MTPNPPPLQRTRRKRGVPELRVIRSPNGSALTKDEARTRVLARISKPASPPYWPDRPPFAIVDEATIERPWGWGLLLLATGWHIASWNAPLIVNRRSRELVETGTAFSTEHYIDQYEMELRAGREQTPGRTVASVSGMDRGASTQRSSATHDMHMQRTRQKRYAPCKAKGGDFKPARRIPGRERTYWNRWGEVRTSG